MTEEEKKSAMARHGITSKASTVYHYEGHSYHSLTDALNYAELIAARKSEPSASRT